MPRLNWLLFLFGLTFSHVFAELVTEAIVGGDFAKKGEFKYHAFLYINKNMHYCGAAIIDNFYILTAAHCVAEPPRNIIMKRFKIILGTHDLKGRKDAITDYVETVYVPRALNLTTNEHDIAILKLKKGLNLQHDHNRIAKLNLPKADANYDVKTAVVSGFGIHKFKIRKNKEGQLERYDVELDQKLRYAHTTIVPNAKCFEMNKKIFKNTPVKPYWMCAQVVQRNKGPEGICNGDSGGPLVHENEVIGILTIGPFNCDETKHPSIYIRVSSYTNMIHNIISGKPGHDVIAIPVPHKNFQLSTGPGKYVTSW